MKTITLGYKDNPTVTICRGHVTATAFNNAYRNEGWKSDWVRKSELRHEYWVKLKHGWTKSTCRRYKKAQPVTVMDW